MCSNKRFLGHSFVLQLYLFCSWNFIFVSSLTIGVASSQLCVQQQQHEEGEQIGKLQQLVVVEHFFFASHFDLWLLETQIVYLYLNSMEVLTAGDHQLGEVLDCLAKCIGSQTWITAHHKPLCIQSV